MKKTLRIGHIDLSFHAASAALVCTVFEKYGWQVEGKRRLITVWQILKFLRG
ncbi:hypothetical protein NLN94_21505 [Citrobacter portucalensis]|uniref:hypothetical protein n=1 Tax=Citrobacter portucalensis TaxID=1639133 RepID=UPI00226BB994|nr:hypothetical protein [Citrobacter portucalensis]MCX9039688.1 hypothetical protein [Citrobacter portucalensis]MCX9063497.1 hypothetical protein [Citrobacter portucalensis]